LDTSTDLFRSQQQQQQHHSIRKSTKEIVAIKVLDLDTDDDEIIDVQKEITVLSHCESEHITRYHGSYLVGTKLWVVMDFAAGGSLRSIVSGSTTCTQCLCGGASVSMDKIAATSSSSFETFTKNNSYS
jgi:serine/threonine protein kinase